MPYAWKVEEIRARWTKRTQKKTKKKNTHISPYIIFHAKRIVLLFLARLLYASIFSYIENSVMLLTVFDLGTRYCERCSNQPPIISIASNDCLSEIEIFKNRLWRFHCQFLIVSVRRCIFLNRSACVCVCIVHLNTDIRTQAQCSNILALWIKLAWNHSVATRLDELWVKVFLCAVHIWFYYISLMNFRLHHFTSFPHAFAVNGTFFYYSIFH